MRCIQRNVRAFLQVRDWPWWRLLVRVTPLLNVHRTEEQLKLAVDELQLLKTKMEKLESDRNSLKTENSKLEGKVRIELIFLYIFIQPQHIVQSLSSLLSYFSINTQSPSQWFTAISQSIYDILTNGQCN